MDITEKLEKLTDQLFNKLEENSKRINRIDAKLIAHLGVADVIDAHSKEEVKQIKSEKNKLEKQIEEFKIDFQSQIDDLDHKLSLDRDRLLQFQIEVDTKNLTLKRILTTLALIVSITAGAIATWSRLNK